MIGYCIGAVFEPLFWIKLDPIAGGAGTRICTVDHGRFAVGFDGVRHLTEVDRIGAGGESNARIERIDRVVCVCLKPDYLTDLNDIADLGRRFLTGLLCL